MNNAQPVKHETTGQIVGDFIVFTCKLCPDYERKVCLKTGKMTGTSDDDGQILHKGTFVNPLSIQSLYN